MPVPGRDSRGWPTWQQAAAAVAPPSGCCTAVRQRLCPCPVATRGDGLRGSRQRRPWRPLVVGARPSACPPTPRPGRGDGLRGTGQRRPWCPLVVGAWPVCQCPQRYLNDLLSDVTKETDIVEWWQVRGH